MGFQVGHVHEKEILREHRVILGLSQQQVADKARIQLRQYQRFESGERNLSSSSFHIACRVIEALEMNISDYYHGEYIFGEEVVLTKEGLRYVKTGKLTSEDANGEKEKGSPAEADKP